MTPPPSLVRPPRWWTPRAGTSTRPARSPPRETTWPSARRPQPTTPNPAGPGRRSADDWSAGGPRTRRGSARPCSPSWSGTGILYLWGLGASGWANSFYSAAVQAGTKSWKAFFFGSFDASNFITVDKPPAALWVMELSARIFGVNSWSILVPQALEGVATVGVLYACVRRWFARARRSWPAPCSP